jgi:hypothetical protein
VEAIVGEMFSARRRARGDSNLCPLISGASARCICRSI